MTGSDSVFAGSVPAIYERLMVPMLFDGYARDMAARVAARGPQDVLELAAGTGAVTRAMAAALPAGVRIVATDLNPAMLEIAEARQAGDARIRWAAADAQALGEDDAAFDAVVCQFGAMFFPDKTAAYREARRVLRDGGHFLFNVWDGIAANAFVAVLSAALAEMFPADPPVFMARTPHGYHDTDRIRAELADAGFGAVEVDTVEMVSRAGSALEAATAYCQGTPLRGEIAARGGVLDDVTARGAAALAAAFGPGAIEGAIRAFVITARR